MNAILLLLQGDDTGKCWNGQEGNLADFAVGLLRGIGNDVANFADLISSATNPMARLMPRDIVVLVLDLLNSKEQRYRFIHYWKRVGLGDDPNNPAIKEQIELRGKDWCQSFQFGKEWKLDTQRGD